MPGYSVRVLNSETIYSPVNCFALVALSFGSSIASPSNKPLEMLTLQPTCNVVWLLLIAPKILILIDTQTWSRTIGSPLSP